MEKRTITQHILTYPADKLSEVLWDNQHMNRLQDVPEEIKKIVSWADGYCLVSVERYQEIAEWLKNHWPELRIDDDTISWDLTENEDGSYRITLNIPESDFRCFLCDNFRDDFKECAHTNMYIIVSYVLCPICSRAIRISTNRFGVKIGRCPHVVEWTYGCGELDILFHRNVTEDMIVAAGGI